MLAIKSLKQIVHASVIDSSCREPCMLAIKSEADRTRLWIRLVQNSLIVVWRSFKFMFLS